MAVMRVHKNANYSVMSNYHFKEKEMSLKAKGLLSLMLSLPDDWDYSIAGLASLSKDGKDSVMSALKELEKFGYLERKTIRNEKGHIKDYEYNIFECPKFTPQDSEKPNQDNPDTEEQVQLSTNVSSTNEVSTYDKKDKRQKPNYLTKMLIDNEYITEDEIFIDMYNYLLDELEETYGLEIIRSCIWYLCKQAKFREIKNKFHYCKASLEDGAMKLSGVKTEEIPDSLQHYYQ